MRWFHGESASETGLVSQFRYGTNEPVTAVQYIKVIEEKYNKGCTVLWIEEGFTPDNLERWDGWLTEEPVAKTPVNTT